MLAQRIHTQLTEHNTLRRTILSPEVTQLLDKCLNLRRTPPHIQFQMPKDTLTCFIYRILCKLGASASRLIESGMWQTGQSGSLPEAASQSCFIHLWSKMWWHLDSIASSVMLLQSQQTVASTTSAEKCGLVLLLRTRSGWHA